MRIAGLGAREALKRDPGFAEGLNTYAGKITYRGVAESQHREWTEAATVLA
jgi:alanine dehydrogenase